ncbi:MAG: hypothetical protein ACK4I8_12040, partial [Armatimonadota bacterium]
MSKVYRDLEKFANPFLTGWRKTRKTNFLLLAWALLLKRTCCLSHLARALPFKIMAQSKVNRFFRFLKSQKDFSFEDFFAKMGLWVLNLFAQRERLVLVIDTTFVKEWMIFSVILPYKGRGLVLQMDAYPIFALPFCQTDLQIAFLERLFSWLPFERSR